MIFKTGNYKYNLWLKWVTVQPVLRKIFGCSFLPPYDYGRGGRGWRDLWQDCLALLFMEPKTVRKSLLNNFSGVRIDGSNATIIGNEPGVFIADRNNIPRVWMDHGVWPFLTTMLYINQTGDLNILLEKQDYFKDKHIRRCKAHNKEWDSNDVLRLKIKDGNIYRGSILEHILVQHLSSFFNVGEHNNILIEGADWNDGLDMARERGESVAFTALYGGNLLEIAKLLESLETIVNEIEIAEEIYILLDSLNNPVNYDSPLDKQKVLQSFFNQCEGDISGNKIKIKINELREDLNKKGRWIYNHIRENEWITNKDGFGWFNGYYDNNGDRLEGDHNNGVRMTLTGQVFNIMSSVATKEQAGQIVRSVKKYLWDEDTGGVRLNTDFKEIMLNMGRCFGYAYGHKENGAVFNHMAVMYANALYTHRSIAATKSL